MIRGKSKWIVQALLLGWIAAVVMVVVVYVPGPGPMAPAGIPEMRIAPVGGDDWPVLENPDQYDIMVAGLHACHANLPA